jgi:hypothetical protein
MMKMNTSGSVSDSLGFSSHRGGSGKVSNCVSIAFA